MVHQASALEQFLSVRPAPTALYTALLHVLLCTACASQHILSGTPESLNDLNVASLNQKRCDECNAQSTNQPMLVTCTYLWFGRWLHNWAQRMGTDLEALACSSSVSDGQPNQNRPLEGRHCPVAPLLPKNRPSQIPARTCLKCKSVHCNSMFLDTLHITLSAECSFSRMQ